MRNGDYNKIKYKFKSNNISSKECSCIYEVGIKKNKEFILQAVKIDANALAYVSPELQGDSDVLLVTTGHPDFDSESWFYSEELQKKLSKFLSYITVSHS